MTAIDWGALATFGTGVLALVAAVIVARKQAAILEKQNETLRQQIQTDTELRSNDLKLRLIDKRAAVISSLREVQAQYSIQGKLERPYEQKLWELTQEAELLFPAEATGLLSELISLQGKARMAAARADASVRRGHDEAAQKSLEQSFEFEDQVYAKFPEVLSRLIDHAAVRL